MTESQLQKSAMEYLLRVYKDWVCFHVPNGGSRRSPREGARLKREGVMPGVPDIILISPSGRVYFIELKTTRGRHTMDQVLFAEKMMDRGVGCVTCRSIDDVIYTMKDWSRKDANH